MAEQIRPLDRTPNIDPFDVLVYGQNGYFRTLQKRTNIGDVSLCGAKDYPPGSIHSFLANITPLSFYFNGKRFIAGPTQRFLGDKYWLGITAHNLDSKNGVIPQITTPDGNILYSYSLGSIDVENGKTTYNTLAGFSWRMNGINPEHQFLLYVDPEPGILSRLNLQFKEK